MEQNKFYQIINITEREYTLVGCDDSVITRPIQDIDKSASAFTIQDAKDGDVLASKDGDEILIFRNLDSNTSFSSYYNIKGEGEIGWSNRSFIPATKEQRDLLFQKMKEAGYRWDSEKKELKKIEQKSAWSEEDVEMLQQVIADIEDLIATETGLKFLANYYRHLNWLKSLKDRVQPKPKWKPNDKQMEYLLTIKTLSPSPLLESLYSDLKKLREE